MSEWKERAIKRADFRHTKADPEVAPRRKKKGGKKKWKLLCTMSWVWLKDGEESEWVYNRYHTEKQALQGLKACSKDAYLKNLRVEGPVQ